MPQLVRCKELKLYKEHILQWNKIKYYSHWKIHINTIISKHLQRNLFGEHCMIVLVLYRIIPKETGRPHMLISW